MCLSGFATESQMYYVNLQLGLDINQPKQQGKLGRFQKLNLILMSLTDRFCKAKM